jgi:MORN repeat variant
MKALIFTFFILIYAFATQAEVICEKPLERYEDADALNIYVWCQRANKKEGPLEARDLTNKLVLKSEYKKDKLHGKFQRFHPNGTVANEGKYKNGKAHGVWKRYYESGKVKDKGAWLDGEPVGNWYFYDESGKLIDKKEFTDVVQDSRLRLRVSYARVSIDPGLADDDVIDAPAIGADVLIWGSLEWLRFRLLVDWARLEFVESNPSGPGKTITTNTLFSQLAAELAPPWSPDFALAFKFGRIFGDITDSSDSISTGGIELRYYFEKKRFLNSDSLFFNVGKAKGRNENGQPGAGDTNYLMMGMAFSLF